MVRCIGLRVEGLEICHCIVMVSPAPQQLLVRTLEQFVVSLENGLKGTDEAEVGVLSAA